MARDQHSLACGLEPRSLGLALLVEFVQEPARPRLEYLQVYNTCREFHS